jgi:acetyl esterase/lipase
MMNRILLCLFSWLMAVAPLSAAKKVFVHNITPDGQAFVKVFLPDSNQSSGRALLSIPGGGYQQTSIKNAELWAPFYLKRGIAYIILRYRMPEGDRTIPISDAEAAMKYVRENSKVWHVNPDNIGIIGSSAGGHLASYMATQAQESLRPNFQILFYPVITMGKVGCHRGSVNNFLGAEANDEIIAKKYSSDENVNENTPPALILASSDDKTVPVLTNSVVYYRSLIEHGISASLQIFPVGGHGWKYNTNFGFQKQMADEVSQWLRWVKPKVYIEKQDERPTVKPNEKLPEKQVEKLLSYHRK